MRASSLAKTCVVEPVSMKRLSPAENREAARARLPFLLDMVGHPQRIGPLQVGRECGRPAMEPAQQPRPVEIDEIPAYRLMRDLVRLRQFLDRDPPLLGDDIDDSGMAVCGFGHF